MISFILDCVQFDSDASDLIQESGIDESDTGVKDLGRRSKVSQFCSLILMLLLD